VQNSRFIYLVLSVLLLIDILITALSANAELGPPVKDMKAEIKKLKEEKVAAKSKQTKVEGILTLIEKAFKQGDNARLESLLGSRNVSLSNGNRVKVYISLRPDIDLDKFDVTRLHIYGVEVVNKFGHGVVAIIPLNVITDTADNIDEISYIELPGQVYIDS